MITVAVLIPSTGRAAKLYEHVGDLLRQVPPDNVQVAVILSIPQHDQVSINVARRMQTEIMARGVELHMLEREPGTTAVQGWRQAFAYADFNGADWFVLGADDIRWDRYWLYHALKAANEARALVIGLDDGGHTDINDYAPHYMAHSRYTDAYDFIPAGYEAWWFDREVCQRARALGVYAPAPNALAEHLHPDWGTAERDSTHQLGQPFHAADRQLYERRKAEGWL